MAHLQKTIKLILLFAFAVVSQYAFAQLKEHTVSDDWQTLGEVKYVGAPKARITFLPGKSDTTYLLLMRDHRYELKDYFSVRFSGKDNTLENLYNILISFFTKENRKNKKYEKLFTLGSDRVFVQHYKQLTSHQIIISTHDGHILLGEGEVKRLFNKK